MKNIHVIPTDKETRLYLSNYGKELNLASHPKTLYTTGQNICITSEKEIKKGDWYYLPRTNLVYECKEDPTELNLERRLGVAKIILTTDQDLIKDGVQAIDDEFLEWFVKNPSCEEIKVEEFEPIYGHQNNSNSVLYKIIIPKEEPKQGYVKSETEFLGIEFTLKDGSKQFVPNLKEEPKQELERGITITHVGKKETLEDKLKSLVKEWQQKQINYEILAEHYIEDQHNNRKFTYKAMATRDCWKELLKLIEDEK